MSHEHYGKCFNDLSDIKRELNSTTIKHKYRNDLSKKMKHPYMLSILFQVNKASSNGYTSVKEAYCNLVETFFNVNPSIALQSYEDGLDYLDNSKLNTLHMLESYFDVELNLFELKHQARHGNAKTRIQKKSKINNKHYYEMTFPANSCTKQNCYFFMTRYASTKTSESNSKVCLVLSFLTKSFDISIIYNLYKFKQKFQPLIGFAYDSILLRDVSVLNHEHQEKLGIKYCQDINISDILNKTSSLCLSLSNNLIILAPISFKSTVKIDRKTINTCYIVKKILRPLNKTKTINTFVFIFDRISETNYNILKSCVSEIEDMYRLGTSDILTKLTEVKALKSNIHPKKIPGFSQCPCESFTNIQRPIQRPLRFNKKCLPIHLSTLDLANDEDFAQRIRLASMISHTFFDIESLQSRVFKSGAKNPGVYIKFNDMVNIVEGYHKIIMIGYSDLINERVKEWYESSGEISLLNDILGSRIENAKTFHLDNNHLDECVTEPNFTNQTELVKRFFEYVYERSVLIEKIKTYILSPLIDYIDALTKLEQTYIMKVNQADNHKTEVDRIVDALRIFLSETLLWGFNSAKYDNVIVMPYLKYLLNKDKNSLFYYRNIRIFRKGRHITDLTLMKNKTKIKCRDFLHIENPYISLEDMAKKYNIVHSKAVFPHKMSESVAKLKKTTGVPFQDKYWKLLNGGFVSVDKRLEAKRLFVKANVSNMYQYMEFYLKLDVLCLQECLFAYQKLLYETEKWDIAANKMLTISTLMYEINYKQEFTNQPNVLPVFEIRDSFIKHVLDMSVIGGITMCMFSGLVGKSLDANKQDPIYPTKINSHLRYRDVKYVSPKWPGLYMLKNKLEETSNKTPDDETSLIINPLEARYIHSYDMLSLYASAMYHDIPVGPCRQWNLGYKDETNQFHRECPTVNNQSSNNYFYRDTVSTDRQEYRFISDYLSNFNFGQYKNVCIRSQFHVGGNVCFEYKSYPDLFIKGRRIDNNILTFYIVHFDGIYYHGDHDKNCNKQLDTFESSDKKKQSDRKHQRRKYFFETFLSFRPREEKVIVNYEVYTSCQMGYCNNKHYSSAFPIPNYRLSSSELLAGILQSQIRGFLVIRNLKIQKSDRNPSFGFAIQKAPVKGEWLSVHTKTLLENFAKHRNIPKERLIKDLEGRQKILGLHLYMNTVVIHTDYFLFLHTHFILNQDFQILHLLEFCHDNILKKKVDYYIRRRFEIKNQIKSIEKTCPNNPDLSYLMAFSSVLKLYNNSLYGFTLLRADNYNSTKYIISHRLDYINQDNVVRARLVKRLSKKTYLIAIESRNTSNTTQAHVGSTIMYRSKITFLSAIIFLLENSDPQHLELLYTDTDSVHCATYHKTLDENMLDKLKESFLKNKSKFFYDKDSNNICGVLDLETVSETHRYITEKMYQKLSAGKYTTAAKGINRYAKKIHLENNKSDNVFHNISKPFSVTSNLIVADANDNIVTKNITREFTSGLVPTKRYFTEDGHSIVFEVD